MAYSSCWERGRGNAILAASILLSSSFIFSGRRTVRGSCCKHCSTYMPILGFLLRGSPQSVLQGRLNNVFATSQGCVLWEWEVGRLSSGVSPWHLLTSVLSHRGLLVFPFVLPLGSSTALSATATEHGYIGLDCQLSVRRLL